MKKSDLKNGMIVDLRDGTRFICMDHKLIGMDTYDYMSEYNEDLTIRWEDDIDLKDLDIVKVYDSQCNTINEIFNTNIPTHFLLWERNEEVDWRRVKFGTKVRVWDDENNKYEGVLLEYIPKEYYPFRVYVKDSKHKVCILWKHCELI